MKNLSPAPRPKTRRILPEKLRPGDIVTSQYGNERISGPSTDRLVFKPGIGSIYRPAWPFKALDRELHPTGIVGWTWYDTRQKLTVLLGQLQLPI